MRVALLALALGGAGCGAILGDHPFSSSPRSDFGRPEPASYFVLIAPHPWLIITPRGKAAVDVRVFVHVTGHGWEDLGVRLEAELPSGRVLAAPVGARSWTLELPARSEGRHRLLLRAVARDGRVLMATSHEWRVVAWSTLEELAR